MTRDEALKRIDQRLEQHFGAQGTTWAGRISSVEHFFPVPLVKQLQALPQMSGEPFMKNAISCLEQIALFIQTAQKNSSEPVWNEKKRSEARAAQSTPVSRLGAPKTAAATKLAWWLHDTRASIPKRAHAQSRVWRLPITFVCAVGGAALGWQMAGLGLALLNAIILGAIGFVLLSEANLARSIWTWTRVVEALFKVFRGAVFLVLWLLGVAAVGGLAWVIWRFWSVR